MRRHKDKRAVHIVLFDIDDVTDGIGVDTEENIAELISVALQETQSFVGI